MKQSEIVKTIILYRYASLISISLFYILGDKEHTIERRIFIVACISISSIIVSYLYMKNENSASNTKLIIFVETIGNSFILIPSGGLNSPYVWYSLNTILEASMKLNKKYCWINLFIYIFSSTYIYSIISGDKYSIINSITKDSNFILSLILITGAIQLLSKYVKKVEERSVKLEATNIELITANEKIKDTMGYIMELYQSVYLLNTQKSRNDLIELIIEYAKKIIKTGTIKFINIKGGKILEECESNTLDKSVELNIINEILRTWNNVSYTETPIEIMIKKRMFIAAPVKYNYKIFGILVIELTHHKFEDSYSEIKDQLKFLADLSGIALKKFDLERVHERLLINEEQNRIANEIHDDILQRLFSTSCGIFETIKKLGKLNTKEIETELNTIRSAINNSMKDLRTIIYSLNDNEHGTDTFISDIKKRINEIKLLNNINIGFVLHGDEKFISVIHKRALYRMICEGIGNAVRHGKAEVIEVVLSIEKEKVCLDIIDNGIGFNLKLIKNSGKTGLGVNNIHQLANSLNGKVSIDSQIGMGTRIKVIIPNSELSCLQELKKEKVI